MACRTGIVLLVMLGFSLTAAFAGGSMFSANGVGEQQVGGGVRALGLGGGGFGLLDTMSFNSMNPGLIAFVPRATMRMSGYLGFWNTTSNGQTDSDGEMSWKEIRLYVPLTNRWKVGAGIEPKQRQDIHTIGIRSGTFTDPVDSTQDIETYEERITWSGSTVDLRFDNAYRITDRFGLGISAIYTIMHNDRTSILDFADEDFRSNRFEQTQTFRRWSFAVGGQYQVSDRFGLGGYFRPRMSGNWTSELSKSGTDSTVKGEMDADGPGEFGVGLSYRLTPGLVGVADVWMGQWSQGDYGVYDAQSQEEPQDPLFVSLGIERLARRGLLHSGFDLWGYRAGLFYRKHYWSTASGEAVADLGMSFGTSLPIARSNGWLHWVGEIGQRGLDEDKLGATETFFRFSFQIEIGETWFQRTKPRIPD